MGLPITPRPINPILLDIVVLPPGVIACLDESPDGGDSRRFRDVCKLLKRLTYITLV
jgi:hypothetical protein